jgi:hypothetical protein
LKFASEAEVEEQARFQIFQKRKLKTQKTINFQALIEIRNVK